MWKPLKKLTTRHGAAESPLDWVEIKFQSWPCLCLPPPSAFELVPTPTPGHMFRSMAMAIPAILGRALQSKLICLVSKGPLQSDPTLPTQPCFPWFPNSSLGFKPSGLLMVPWGNIPGSLTEFLRLTMPLLLCFGLSNSTHPARSQPSSLNPWSQLYPGNQSSHPWSPLL